MIAQSQLIADDRRPYCDLRSAIRDHMETSLNSPNKNTQQIHEAEYKDINFKKLWHRQSRAKDKEETMSAPKTKFKRDMSLFNQKDFKEAKKSYDGWLGCINCSSA